jgi:hypothetical protein
LSDEADRLYALPLDQFIGERDAAARRLREAGDREAAAEVKKLRKPNRPAWAINQAVRANPPAARRLVKAGEELERAQRAALGGKGGQKLRGAIAAHHEAVEEVTEESARSLESKDATPAVLDRIRETLRAVAADEDLQAEFADGRLTRDREAVGFGGSGPETVRARPAKRERRSGKAAAEDARLRDARRKVKAAERALRTAARRVEGTEGRLARARQAFDEARVAHDEAEREHGEREAELADARAVLEELSD